MAHIKMYGQSPPIRLMNCHRVTPRLKVHLFFAFSDLNRKPETLNPNP